MNKLDKNGKEHGQWETTVEGVKETGEYKHGKKHGRWEIQYPSGKMEIGQYENDKKHGRWEIREANGEVYIYHYKNGVTDGDPITFNKRGRIEYPGRIL